MKQHLTFTLDYWKDDGWFVGQLREVPGVLSQGETLGNLQENILAAYWVILKDNKAHAARPRSRSKSIPICVPA